MASNRAWLDNLGHVVMFLFNCGEVQLHCTNTSLGSSIASLGGTNAILQCICASQRAKVNLW